MQDFANYRTDFQTESPTENEDQVMKKLLIVLTFILLPFQSEAAGVYDGI